eukprot:GFUD01106500.1.p1 GENE.GFUD01106500.1~~GFUD01106500.1.p1  ORF type:complete len:340 (+),score=75.69 GFUD01106500.1:49-1068(+)
MPPLYSGSADEWGYFNPDLSGSTMTTELIFDNYENLTTPIKSNPYSVNEILWGILVPPPDPTSQSEESKELCSVWVKNESKEDLTVHIKVAVGIKELKFQPFKKQMAAGSNWKVGFNRKCDDTIIGIKECLSDGKLVLKVEVKVLKEEVSFIYGKGKSFNPVPDTSSVTLKMFEEKAFTDFLVICNDKSFACHKAFLTARSPVFKAMMESDMKEAKEGAIELENCDETVAESFVKFFYTGQVDEEVLKENIAKFLELSDKYDLSCLKAIAEQIMIANLDIVNMLGFFLAGDLYHGEKIRAAAKTFLRQNRRSLVKQEGWREASKNHDLVLELMESFSQD